MRSKVMIAWTGLLVTACGGGNRPGPAYLADQVGYDAVTRSYYNCGLAGRDRLLAVFDNRRHEVSLKWYKWQLPFSFFVSAGTLTADPGATGFAYSKAGPSGPRVSFKGKGRRASFRIDDDVHHCTWVAQGRSGPPVSDASTSPWPGRD